MALVAVICLPGIAAIVLISETAGPNLFDLIPLVSRRDGYVLLGWSTLERTHHALTVAEISSGSMIRALGYMMDDDQPVRDGERVRSFLLLPDPGNALHPAHRFGDETIRVLLQSGSEALFSGRSLVWVWGTLRRLPGDPSGREALYVLENARTEPAKRADIPIYFR